MPIGAIGGAISGAGSLIGGLIGGNAASNAANEEVQALKQAEAYQEQQEGQAVNQQQATTANITGELSPYNALGQQSSASLQSLLAPGGALTQGYGPTFTPPTAQQAAQTPGYQFQLQQGLSALQNSAAARGGLLSSGTAKNLTNYAEGLASTNYNNAYNQALQTYGTNYSVFNNNQNNLYNRLAGTSQLGLSAGSTLGSLQQQGANALNNVYMESGQQVGNDLAAIGQAQAAGTVGAANAYSGAIGGAANSIGSGITLSQLLNAQNAGGSMSNLAAGSGVMDNVGTPGPSFDLGGSYL